MSHSAWSVLKTTKVRLAVAFGVSVGIGATDGEADAQDTQQPLPSDSAISLPAVRVHGQTAPDAGSGNTNSQILNISRMPATVRDTPQTINVIPQELIKEQRAFTLDQALANVPGITLSTGEGNGGLNGDQFRIRGLQARQDMYTDGLKDFGTYTRDTFNMESVQVIKGPSGEYFGAGNVGGVINQSLKHAHSGESYDYDQAFGSASQFRGAGDINYQISNDVALRVNGMYNRQNVADRDHVTANRYGTAVDLAVGLQSKTSWHLTWQWLNGDSKPDYGVPMIQLADGIYRPITSHGLARNTSYTRNFDRDRSDVHNLTSAVKSEITRWFTLTNDTRLTKYEREYTATTPSSCSGSCAAQFLNGGNPALAYGAGGGAAYRQKGWGAQNILMGQARFKTGFIKHDIKAGVDVNYVNDDRYYGSWAHRVNNQTIRDPQYAYANPGLTFPRSGFRNADATDVGLFFSDRIQITKKLSLFGTARWDAFKSTYATDTGGSRQQQKSDRWSPSGSIVYSPVEMASFYFTFARSYKPVGTDVASMVTNSATTGEVAQNSKNFSPQRSDLFEFGSKADFFQKRLGATLSFFQINESNSFYYDENGDLITGFADQGSGRRIRGAELTLNGKITKNWQIFSSYSYMDGKVTNSATASGNEAPQVPHNNFSVWTSYDLTDRLLSKDWGRLKVAGGAQYASGYWAGPDVSNTARMPYNFSLNGTVSWELKHYRVSFNANNLTDHLNYASSFSSGRAVPLSGRTFLGNVGVSF
ncbi:TonB-dependent receptor [Acetobacter fallax]|uniref:TonB-dependent receptor n=1 Tax=Acetobacter fallax TaxID=1737473 RepID=A0ABX0K6I9_9PROT|nr:TonB-dependent receptor [Acetobacter fallax]NHO31362.1 TonB-dependent receptor [Acetobacter fallax]NHO34919.1 TonB-dependent receptor [Acetobacter fallax]